MTTDDGSEKASSSSSSSSGGPSRSPTPPQALALGREKRATAGNKLRALLDAEFQEEEIFAEEQDDEEFIRAKSDDEEEGAYLTDSSSDSEGPGDGDGDEEAGERELEEERKRTRQAAAARKRKATAAPFVKPVSKRPRIPTESSRTPGILASKPASTTSSVSNRRISFDPALLASRRSSRKLTVQTTNETHERIISAAARRATLPVVPKRERTPPLTQEERLAQAVLTEKENKMSLQRIIQAEEERARKRREKLEALRRRRFDEPLLRFVSRRRALVQEATEEKVVEVEAIDDDEGIKVDGEGEQMREAFQNGVGGSALLVNTGDGEKIDVDDKSEGTSSPKQVNKPIVDQSATESKGKSPPQDKEPPKPVIHPPELRSPTSPASQGGPEKMDVYEDHKSTKDMEEIGDTSKAPSATTPKPPENEIDKDSTKLTTQTQTNGDPPENQQETPSQTTIQPPPCPPRFPQPYHEAYYTSNTLTLVPLPTSPLLPPSARETFFPRLPTLPPPKPKPTARCPITGLPVRYKDPLTGVGYYDIHAFAILREVAKVGGRYVWCDEGGWFVGETGTTGRPAKGVPEGWFA